VEVAAGVVEIHVVERRPRDRDGPGRGSRRVERGEDGGRGLGAALDARVEARSVDEYLVHSVERLDGGGGAVSGRSKVDGHRLASKLALEVVRPAFDDDLAPADDRDALGQPIGLLEVVRAVSSR
jgi:hypothetical protein